MDWPLLRSITGPGVALGGFGVMFIQGQLCYVIGISIVYLGFAIWVVESFADPAMRKAKWFSLPFGLLGFAMAILFTFKFVLVNAPLDSDAYVMHDGDQKEVEGMPWSQHYTDLRVWVNNRTGNDYHAMRLKIQPDRWNHAAKIVGNTHGCELNPIGEGRYVELATNVKGGPTTVTEHWEGTSGTVEDRQGDKFEPLLYQSGYFLDCDRLPSNSSVQIVFALGAEKPELQLKVEDGVPAKTKRGKSWIAMGNFSPATPDDFLAPPPVSSSVIIDGEYCIGPKKIVMRSRKQRVINAQ
jgi:hypothetical protein